MEERQLLMKHAKPILFILMILLLAGCVPTPDVEIIPNKGDQKEWQAEARPYLPEDDPPAETPVGDGPTLEYEQQESPLYDLIDSKPLWNMDNREYGFLITARDCPVYLPDVAAVPVIEAQKRSFTQEDIDAVAEAMFPPDTVWYPEVLWTKEELAVIMQETMEEAAKGDPDAAENGHNSKYFEDKLAMYKQRYDEAPFEADIVPITLEINPCQDDIRLNDPTKKYLGVKAETLGEGVRWKLNARTEADDPLMTYLEASRCGNMWIDREQPLDAPYGVKMTREEAIRKSTDFVRSIAGNEYSVCYCVPMAAHAEQQENGESYALPERWSQWGLVFMRTFNGCPSAYAAEEVGGDMDSTVSRPIHYERIIVHIDDQGVSYFRWNTPMTVTGVVSSNADLIPFGDAEKTAMMGIQARFKYDVEDNQAHGKETVIYLARVTFGLWRISRKNGGWYYVPVYHFFTNAYQGTGSWSTAEGFWGDGTPRERFLKDYELGNYAFMDNSCMTFGGDYWGAVTINALDGTIINKDKGY